MIGSRYRELHCLARRRCPATACPAYHRPVAHTGLPRARGYDASMDRCDQCSVDTPEPYFMAKECWTAPLIDWARIQQRRGGDGDDRAPPGT